MFSYCWILLKSCTFNCRCYAFCHCDNELLSSSWDIAQQRITLQLTTLCSVVHVRHFASNWLSCYVLCHQLVLPGSDHTFYEQKDMHVAAIIADKDNVDEIKLEIQAFLSKYRGYVGFLIVDKWVVFWYLTLLVLLSVC